MRQVTAHVKASSSSQFTTLSDPSAGEIQKVWYIPAGKLAYT